MNAFPREPKAILFLRSFAGPALPHTHRNRAFSIRVQGRPVKTISELANLSGSMDTVLRCIPRNADGNRPTCLRSCQQWHSFHGDHCFDHTCLGPGVGVEVTYQIVKSTLMSNPRTCVDFTFFNQLNDPGEILRQRIPRSL